MAATSPVYSRIDTHLKDRAETILSKLPCEPAKAFTVQFPGLLRLLFSYVLWHAAVVAYSHFILKNSLI